MAKVEREGAQLEEADCVLACEAQEIRAGGEEARSEATVAELHSRDWQQMMKKWNNAAGETRPQRKQTGRMGKKTNREKMQERTKRK